MAWLADLVDLTNERLGDRHLGVGPSYFMGNAEELDEAHARRIWNRAVIPYIEEQFFGNEDRLAEFDFDLLKAGLPQPVNGLAPDFPPSEAVEIAGYPANGETDAPLIVSAPGPGIAVDANAPTV